MSSAEQYQIILNRRRNLAGRVYQAVYDAWLEEEIETGRIRFPGGFENFRANRAAACRAEWRGPAKPQADDLKTAKAHQIYKQMGVMTDEQICMDLGNDWEDTYEQLDREAKMRRRFGIEQVIPGSPAPAPEEDEEDEDA